MVLDANSEHNSVLQCDSDPEPISDCVANRDGVADAYSVDDAERVAHAERVRDSDRLGHRHEVSDAVPDPYADELCDPDSVLHAHPH